MRKEEPSTSQPLNASRLLQLSGHFDLRAITILRLSSQNLTNINAISLCPNLVYLDISQNKIKDLSPLSRLSKLSDLDISFNEVSDFSPLAGLISLSRLNLEGNKLDNPSQLLPLKNLKNLGSLGLSTGNIGSIGPRGPMDSSVAVSGQGPEWVSPGLSSEIERFCLEIEKNRQVFFASTEKISKFENDLGLIEAKIERKVKANRKIKEDESVVLYECDRLIKDLDLAIKGEII